MDSQPIKVDVNTPRASETVLNPSAKAVNDNQEINAAGTSQPVEKAEIQSINESQEKARQALEKQEYLDQIHAEYSEQAGRELPPFTEAEKADLLVSKADSDSLKKLTPEQLKYLEEMRVEESAHMGNERPPYNEAERDELLALKGRIDSAGGNQKYLDQLVTNANSGHKEPIATTTPQQNQENK